ncbi:UNVERIFIED_CONTAM: hypothetical protein GTU68_062137 [Idotea baltica]|nr:hypothetical protein [Idotea baltica]
MEIQSNYQIIKEKN